MRRIRPRGAHTLSCCVFWMRQNQCFEKQIIRRRFSLSRLAAEPLCAWVSRLKKSCSRSVAHTRCVPEHSRGHVWTLARPPRPTSIVSQSYTLTLAALQLFLHFYCDVQFKLKLKTVFKSQTFYTFIYFTIYIFFFSVVIFITILFIAINYCGIFN